MEAMVFSTNKNLMGKPSFRARSLTECWMHGRTICGVIYTSLPEKVDTPDYEQDNRVPICDVQ